MWAPTPCLAFRLSPFAEPLREPCAHRASSAAPPQVPSGTPPPAPRLLNMPGRRCLFGFLWGLLFVRRFLFFRRWNALSRCRRFFIGRRYVISCAFFAVFPAGAEGKRHADRQQQTEKPFHPASPPLARPRAEQIKNARISTATMVEPTGVPAKMEIKMPSAAQLTDSTAEQTVTDRKF